VSSVDIVHDNEMAKNGPLQGVHVLDLSRVLAGPYATMILGDLGADVIKLEQPAGGDDTRLWGPPFIPTATGRESTYFLSTNRNKRSVTVDMKDPAEREFIEQLVKWADVIVENFRPGVMDRLDLGDQQLESLNPGLVRLSISGFGDDGPESRRVGYDLILQAEGGMMSITGPVEGPMIKVGVPIADITAGLYAVIAARRPDRSAHLPGDEVPHRGGGSCSVGQSAPDDLPLRIVRCGGRTDHYRGGQRRDLESFRSAPGH
jgi:crotonobetainyl-CoA:carnitine CoA-transferase CaiB-like acyl-CoA transferase